jgi:hypothetical protein
VTELVIVVAAVVEHDGLPNMVEGVLDWGKTAGTVGNTALGPTGPTIGDTVSVGTAAAELTPRLPISKDPSGMPVRAPPPGVVGVVDVGVEDEAMLEPEPHIPDIPDVSIAIAEVVGVPDAADVPDVPDIPDDIDDPAVPIAVPPPSKVAVDPNIPDGEVPEVEHVVPLPGIAIVPVELVSSGLTPGDAISVPPSGICVGPTGAPGPLPSGEVMPSEGVGATPTWANAGPHIKAQAEAITKKRFIEASCERACWSIHTARRSCAAVCSGRCVEIR